MSCSVPKRPPQKARKISVMLIPVLVLSSCALFYALRPLYSSVQTVSTLSSANSAALPVIVIDAGHGGMDGGASGTSGVPERDINLAVAERTRLLLTLLGFSTRMTRETEADIAPDGDYPTIRSRKVADMRARAELTASYSDAVLLSIHMNSYTDARYHGAQVFYAPADGSQALAESLQAHLAAVSKTENTRSAAAVSPTLYLYRTVSCPAVLIECGFLTNAAEERALLTAEYQTLLSLAISTGAAEVLLRPAA